MKLRWNHFYHTFFNFNGSYYSAYIGIHVISELFNNKRQVLCNLWLELKINTSSYNRRSVVDMDMVSNHTISFTSLYHFKCFTTLSCKKQGKQQQ